MFSGLGICLVVVVLACTRVFAQPLDPSLAGYDQVKTPTRPKLKVVSPQTDSTILGERVMLEYIISGVKLIDVQQKYINGRVVNVRGEGHLLVSFARADSLEKETTPQAFVHKSPIIFENIPEGEYRLSVEIVKNSGDSYLPPVREVVEFGVKHVTELSPTVTPWPTPTEETVVDKIQKNRQIILLVVGIVLVLLPPIFLLSRRLWSFVRRN